MLNRAKVEEKLREVLDPELGINIMDLGLVYDYQVKNNNVFILMTLTFPGCPLGATIHNEIKERVGSLPKVGEVKLEITFNPPWDLSKISPEARAELEML